MHSLESEAAEEVALQIVWEIENMLKGLVPSLGQLRTIMAVGCDGFVCQSINANEESQLERADTESIWREPLLCSVEPQVKANGVEAPLVLGRVEYLLKGIGRSTKRSPCVLYEVLVTKDFIHILGERGASATTTKEDGRVVECFRAYRFSCCV